MLKLKIAAEPDEEEKNEEEGDSNSIERALLREFDKEEVRKVGEEIRVKSTVGLFSS